MNKTPEMIMLVGLVASGKTAYANTLKDNYIIHSSDALREELFGDVNENSKEANQKVFEELHKRVKEDLKKGNNVVYDATNINMKRRKSFLMELKNIPCTKTCLLIMSPYYLCLEHNKQRERNVPEDVIKRMYMNFQPPNKIEGWDKIDIILSCQPEDYKDFDLSVLYNRATGIDFFDQGNNHHSLTLGEHCRKASEYILDNYPDNAILPITALLHDEGKVFTRTAINAKGERDGQLHYYQHHCVGAYNSIFYLMNKGFSVDDILHVSTLIYFHMHPFRSWENETTSVAKRHKIQLGEDLYNEIWTLHKADRFAH